MSRKNEIILPQLNECNGKLFLENGKPARWFVYYSVINPITRELERVKCYKGINKHATSGLRRAQGNRLILQLTKKLESGYNPFANASLDQYINRKKEKGIVIETITNTMLSITRNAKTQKTKTVYKNYISKICDFLKEKQKHYRLYQLNEELAIEFDDMLKQKYSLKTRNEIIYLTKKVFWELVKKRIVQSNPFENITKISHVSKGFKYYSPLQLESIKPYTEEKFPQLYLFMQIIYYCAIRYKEAMLLQLSDIDFSGGTITVPASLSKNRKQQPVIIPEQLMEHFRNSDFEKLPGSYYLFTISGMPGITPVGGGYFRKQFIRVRKACSLPKDFKLYGLKHTAAVRLSRQGTNIKEIQQHFRHSSLVATDEYLKKLVPSESVVIRNGYPNF